MQYQGVEKIQKNGSIAVVTIKVFDSELGKHFLVELAMQQLADDTWQITKINNLKTLINERDQPYKTNWLKLTLLYKSRSTTLLPFLRKNLYNFGSLFRRYPPVRSRYSAD